MSPKVLQSKSPGIPKEKVVFPPHFVEQIRRHFQSLIETLPQQKISQNIFKEQVKKDELAVLKQKYSEATLLSKIRTERKRHLSKTKQVFFTSLLSMYSFYSKFNDNQSSC